jgi:hypothetical protein
MLRMRALPASVTNAMPAGSTDIGCRVIQSQELMKQVEAGRGRHACGDVHSDIDHVIEERASANTVRK